MVSSRHRAPTPLGDWIVAKIIGASSIETASKCRTGDTFLGDGDTASRLPYQPAGFAPCRSPFAEAEVHTLSIRPRTRFSVSVFDAQIGRRISMTGFEVTASTGKAPMT